MVKHWPSPKSHKIDLQKGYSTYKQDMKKYWLNAARVLKKNKASILTAVQGVLAHILAMEIYSTRNLVGLDSEAMEPQTE